jgi:WD40 repeat protein
MQGCFSSPWQAASPAWDHCSFLLLFQVIMSTSRRIAIGLLAVSLIGVTVFGLLALWGYRSIQSVVAGPPPLQYDKPTELANISVPSRPYALAWSADGAYLAAGTIYSDPSEIFIVDVAKASVTHTLKVTGLVQALAFAPDVKSLAVGTRQSLDAGAAAGELVVYDVPGFTAKFTAKATGPQKRFMDLAWAGDCRALYAIDGAGIGGGKTAIRRWTLPAFTEQPAISEPQIGQFTALAVSPDGRTLAVADDNGLVTPRLVRLFEPGSGAQRFAIDADQSMARLGFTPDGKAVGLSTMAWWDVATGRPGRPQPGPTEIGLSTLSWWDVATGRSAKPEPARYAIQPAGLSEELSHYSMPPDGSKWARGAAVLHGFGDLSFGKDNKFGSFVYVTDTTTGKKLTWRVGDAAGTTDSPAVSFSPDGKKLAGTVTQPKGQSIVIWAAPK